MKRMAILFFGLLLAVLTLRMVTFPAHGTSIPGGIPAKQYIVLIDLSASRNKAMLDEERQFLNELAGKLGFGDQIVLLQMQQAGLTDHPLHWTVTMPSPKDASFVTSRDRNQLTAAQSGVRLALPSFFEAKDAVKVNHTDIFTTLQLAGESAHDGGARQTVLVLLSDMLQSGQGFEMERLAKMPPPSWIETEAHDGLMPQLGRVCVVAIGADATTASGVKIRNFWQAYFARAGARLLGQNYRATPPTVGAEFCN